MHSLADYIILFTLCKYYLLKIMLNDVNTVQHVIFNREQLITVYTDNVKIPVLSVSLLSTVKLFAQRHSSGE